MILTSWAEWAKSFSASSLERKSIVSFEGTIDCAKKNEKGYRSFSSSGFNPNYQYPTPFSTFPPLAPLWKWFQQWRPGSSPPRPGSPWPAGGASTWSDRPWPRGKTKQGENKLNLTDRWVETAWNLVSVYPKTYCALVQCSLRSVARSGGKLLLLRRWQF